MTSVPAIDCGHLSDTEVRTLGLAINRIGEKGEWDLDQLKIEFEELIELDVDLESTGFSVAEADIILLDPLEPGPAPDAIPPTPKVAITHPGDLWALGEHLIFCGDALQEASFTALMGQEIADLIITDPPFNVAIKGNVSGLGKTVHDEFAMASGEMSEQEFREFLLKNTKLLSAHARANSVLFIFMDWRSVALLTDVGKAAGLKQINLAVWYKEQGSMGGLYRSAHELIAIFCKGVTPHTNNVALGKNGRDRQNVWCAPGANRPGSSANEMLKEHATPKPVELIADAILDVSSRGDLVLDTFLGSGTTLIAAEKTGRRCRAMELEPRFVDVAIKRWEKFTGEDAILVSTGESWAAVAIRRLTETDDGGEI